MQQDHNTSQTSIHQSNQKAMIKLSNYVNLMHALGYIQDHGKSEAEEQQLAEIWKWAAGDDSSDQVKIVKA